MTSEQLMVTAAINSWKTTVGRASKVFSNLTEDQFLQPVAPGRNRIIYLLGHLTAVHDAMLPLLGVGERLHPELDEIFIKNPDRAIASLPAADTLKTYWNEVNDVLWKRFEELSAEQWVARHTAVSEEDFAKEPGRNRFNVLLGRTNHMAFHMGQIILAPK